MSGASLQLAQSVVGRILEMAARAENRVEREVLRPAGLSLLSWRVLDLVAQAGPLTFTAIADELHLAKGSLSGILAKLESEALVHRTPDERDGRRVLVQATSHGRSLQHRLAPLVAAVQVRGFEEMPANDLVNLDAALAAFPAGTAVVDMPNTRRRRRRDVIRRSAS